MTFLSLGSQRFAITTVHSVHGLARIGRPNDPSMLIYVAVSSVLVIVMIGFPLLGILGPIAIAFPVIAGIKANNGEVWKYPLSIPFLK